MLKMPTLFVSHGPPAILMMEGPTPDFLRSLGHRLPHPQGVLCVSAHWETVAPQVTATVRPATIYDFSGPGPLLEKTYDVPGDPGLAREVVALIRSIGVDAAEDTQRGLDHGAWVPLMMMYPGQDIPVVQLSVQTEHDPEYHRKVGEALRPLRESGVLIMGSGGAVHNLDEVYLYRSDDQPPEYVRAFDAWLEKAVTEEPEQSPVDYLRTAPDPRRAHPFPAEHFLPFFVPFGAAGGAKASKIHHGFMYGTLSMAAYLWE